LKQYLLTDLYRRDK